MGSVASRFLAHPVSGRAKPCILKEVDNVSWHFSSLVKSRARRAKPYSFVERLLFAHLPCQGGSVFWCFLDSGK